MKAITNNTLEDSPFRVSKSYHYIPLIKTLIKKMHLPDDMLLLESPSFYDILLSVASEHAKTLADQNPSPVIDKKEEKPNLVWTDTFIDTENNIHLRFDTIEAENQYKLPITKIDESKCYIVLTKLDDEKHFKTLFDALPKYQKQRVQPFIDACLSRIRTSNRFDFLSGDRTKLNKIHVYLKIISIICNNEDPKEKLTPKEQNILWEVHWYKTSQSAHATKKFFINNTVKPSSALETTVARLIKKS